MKCEMVTISVQVVGGSCEGASSDRPLATLRIMISSPHAFTQGTCFLYKSVGRPEVSW